ncbi:MAG TPA: hypothetical protein VHE34_22685 [Puia sp.]|uniref:hypothetical protein n=1 Tax=Puia sp. TaxID=2045100 RepID=UPI002CE9F10F|nr:hypothetical protein [Puia sp.]HVU98055.1 hypothetical protein [Puia sp.]
MTQPAAHCDFDVQFSRDGYTWQSLDTIGVSADYNGPGSFTYDYKNPPMASAITESK